MVSVAVPSGGVGIVCGLLGLASVCTYFSRTLL